VIVLSIFSPVFQRYLVGEGKRAVDIGADAFFIDEIQTSALLIGRKEHSAGFSAREMAAYQEHLDVLGYASPVDYLLAEDERDWLTEEVRDRLQSREVRRLSVAEVLRLTDPPLDGAQDALFRHYRRFYEDEAFRIMAGIIDQVRDYASDRGRALAIGANVTGMGSATFWSSTLSVAWGPLVDFIAFENEPDVIEGPLTSLPEGSFGPAYRLGNALVPGFVVAFPSVSYAPALVGTDYETYLSVMFAEAFATEGNWGIGWWATQMGWPRDELAPESLADLTRFVKEHDRLYEGPRTAARIAVLYTMQGVLADPDRHDSYFGLAQALSELNVQFDVLYSGDDRFLEVPLSEEELGGYEIVLAPTANDLTERQRSALSAYVAGGGHLIAVGPAVPDLTREAGVRTVHDLGREYRFGDQRSALDDLSQLVGGVGRIVLGASGSGVHATAYVREDLPGLVVHFVNYNYDPFSDSIAAAENIEVQVERPSAFDDTWQLSVLTPGGETRSVPYTIESGTIRFVLPELDVYAVALFTSRA
jgi:hypothetical protein